MAKFKSKVFETRWYHYVLVRFNWLLIIGIALILFFSEYNYIIKPAFKMAKVGGAAEVSSYQKALEEEKKYLNGLKALKEETDKISKLDLEKLDYVVSSGQNLASVLNQIYLLASLQNLSIQNFSISSTGGVTTVGLGLGNSTYEIFKKFLAAAENNIQIMDVTDLNLAADGTSFTVTIKTYYQE